MDTATSIPRFGQDRGAECVDVRDDLGTGRFPDEKNTCGLSAADDPKNFNSDGTPKTCDSIGRDTHCVCKKPDNTAHLGLSLRSLAVAVYL